MKKHFKISLLFFALFVGLIFVYTKGEEIKTVLNMSAQAQTEPDAIAVRIKPNPDHYDPLRWYKEQGFQGNPERLTVNGYNAIIDDRTVYVNAANIINDTFYTNIYIISFTQQPTPNTVEIFHKMLDNWTLNTNLLEEGEDLGTCSISRINCASDDDCSSDYKCSDNWKCVPKEQINCYNDSECPANIFCDSGKAVTTRDTERMAHMKELEILAEKYQENYGDFPKLEAGTYAPGKTISVWPSWENTFQKEMSEIISEYSVFDSLPKDPINRLSRCYPGSNENLYNLTTCWDEVNKTFSGSISPDSIALPTHNGPHPYTGKNITYKSHAYTYVYGSFDICAPLESKNVKTPGFVAGECSPNNSVDSNISFYKDIPNDPPQINCGILSAHPGDEFSRFIQANDPEGDSIEDWEINTNLSSWPGWSSPPNIEQSFLEKYARVYADSVGHAGEYEFEVTAMDSAGNSASEICTIKSGNNPPILSFSCPSSVRVGNDYECNLSGSAYDPDGDDVSFNSVSGLPAGISYSDSIISGNASSKGSYTINVEISDDSGETASDFYTLNVNTYCGDGRVQSPNGEGGSEECDKGNNNGNPCEPGYETSCEWCDNSCNLHKEDAIGECGDGNIQTEFGEQCDRGNSNGNVCVPAYKKSCEWCDNSCNLHKEEPSGKCGDGVVQENYEDCESNGSGAGPDNQYECAGCQWTGGYCGDGAVQGGHGEQCEQGVNCSNCRWTCSQSEQIALNFGGSNSVQLAPGESTTITTLPACTGVTRKLEIDTEMVDVSSGESLGVVYVTDSSGSMPNGMNEVKTALKNSIDNLNNELTNPTEVGLVEFNSGIESKTYPLELNNVNAATLKNQVNTYDDGGGTTTGVGINEAHNMLNAGNYDIKVMIILADGDSHDNPGQDANAAKSDGIEIYTIGYGGGAPDMESWASSPASQYAYSSENANAVYSAITNSIVSTPNSNIEVTVNNTTNTISPSNGAYNFNGISCDPYNSQSINFQNDGFSEGEVKYSNPRIEVCPTK